MTPVDLDKAKTAEGLNELSEGTLVRLLGISVNEVGPARASGELTIRPEHLAPNAYLHAGTVIALADTIAGYGCLANLPDGARGFTTIELKSNFLGTAREGVICATATLRHGGRTTQVWDAEVSAEDGKAIATFRCTQLILWPA